MYSSNDSKVSKTFYAKLSNQNCSKNLINNINILPINKVHSTKISERMPQFIRKTLLICENTCKFTEHFSARVETILRNVY
jgi:hypothetical protein